MPPWLQRLGFFDPRAFGFFAEAFFATAAFFAAGFLAAGFFAPAFFFAGAAFFAAGFPGRDGGAVGLGARFLPSTVGFGAGGGATGRPSRASMAARMVASSCRPADRERLDSTPGMEALAGIDASCVPVTSTAWSSS